MQFRPQRTWDGAGRALEEQKADCASQPGWLFSPDREVSPLLTVVFLLPAPAPPPGLPADARKAYSRKTDTQ